MLAQSGQDEFAFDAVGAGVVGLEVDNFRVEMILKNVQTALARALDGDSRARDFRKAINIVRLQGSAGFNMPAHSLTPWFCPENARPQWEIFDPDSQLVSALQKMD